MSNSTKPMLLQDKLGVLRLQHLGNSHYQISEKIGSSLDSVETILSQKRRITKFSSPDRSRKHLTIDDRLCAVHLVECGERHEKICPEFDISMNTLHRQCSTR